MTNKPELVRSDGQPARQFGEEIIEPGEAYTDDTLHVIRTLVDEHDSLVDDDHSVSARASQGQPDTVAQGAVKRDESSVTKVVQLANTEFSAQSFDEDGKGMRPLLHFATPAPAEEVAAPRDWVGHVHRKSNSGLHADMRWRVNKAARGVALVFLAVAAFYAA